MAGIFGITVNILTPIFLVVGAAALFGRLYKPDARVLAALLLYVFVPALVLRTIANTDAPLGDVAGIGGSILATTALLYLLGRGLGRLLRFDSQQTTAFLVSIMMVNAANYGLPLNEFAFGPQGLEIATIYYVLTVIIGNNTAIFVASQGQVGLRRAFVNVLRVPVLPATVLGVLLNVSNTTIPLAIDRALEIMAAGVVPGMLALLGLRLATVNVQRGWRPLLLAAGVRLVGAALIVTPIALLFGLRDLPLKVTIVQSSTPTAVLAAAIALEFGADADFVSAVTLVTTLLSIITMTVLLAILGVS